ncbi:MAG: hypothetical protein ACYSUX_01225 [Planctomycetota bacterium]|jgi:uncharacterized repeat protein (TIGR01451 family)
MKNKNKKNALSSNIILTLLAITMLTTVVTKTATAKSLYVIADIKGASEDRTQPVQAYDIGVDGTLIFQAQHDIPHSMLGAVGMAIDSDNGYVFITYEASGDIRLIEATTMTDAGRTRAPDASDLAGIVYDHENSLVYTVDRVKNTLYVYNWWPESATLTHAQGSPFRLENASAYGIALDEIDDLLYVANASNTITVYSTSDWSLVDTISVSRIAISIAVDVTNGLLYTGGGFAGNMFLTQYHLAKGIEAEVQVEPDAGVMGLGVDPDTGLVYMSTGTNNAPGGDNLLVYDTSLNQIDIVTAIGNPTGLAIPGKDIGYNPLNLDKEVLRGASAGIGPDDLKTVGPGDTYTYGISFKNDNDFTVTDVFIVDMLPQEVSFISADDNGVNGYYDPDTHSYIWSYELLPPGSSTLLELTVKVNNDVENAVIITNKVTINSNQTTPTTTSVDVITSTDIFNLRKSILVPGSIGDQTTQVQPGDTIIYAIDFDNKDNDFTVTNVKVVDYLPDEVVFVRADDDNGNGKYNAKERTYTWTYDSLPPGAVKHLEMEVLVNTDVPLGTVITNIVTINTDETSESSTSVDAVTSYKPLNITKEAVDNEGNDIVWVDPGDKFTYKICFDNNNNIDTTVSDVLLIDILPNEVTFVSDQADNKNFTGVYNPKSHTYTGTLKSLEPGITTCVELVVDVNENTPLGTMIVNSATVDSNETLPATAEVIVPVGEIFLQVENLSITPNELRRNGTSPAIMAVVQLPEGITKDDIEPDDLPKLSYQDRDSDKENFIPIGTGSQSISGTEDRPVITVLFNRAELMNAVYGYGPVKLRVQGKLTSGLFYFGDAMIHLTRFAGD